MLYRRIRMVYFWQLFCRGVQSGEQLLFLLIAELYVLRNKKVLYLFFLLGRGHGVWIFDACKTTVCFGHLLSMISRTGSENLRIFWSVRRLFLSIACLI